MTDYFSSCFSYASKHIFYYQCSTVRTFFMVCSCACFSGVTCNLLTCIYDYNNFQKYITHDFHDRVIPVFNAVLPADLTISVLQYWIAAFTGISVDNLNV